jgi:hypothetical protein
VKTKGQFILMTLDEFKLWLDKLKMPRKVTLLQNHNTGSPNYSHWRKKPDALYWQEVMKRVHLRRGFSDIAQHITTHPDGTIAIGRDFDSSPAGISGANTGAICMEHFGWFDRGKDRMTPEQTNAIVAVNALLCKKFKLIPYDKTIVYHAWYNRDTGIRDNDNANKKGNYKTCPGTAFFGGNSVRDFRKYFQPLIVDYLKKGGKV